MFELIAFATIGLAAGAIISFIVFGIAKKQLKGSGIHDSSVINSLVCHYILDTISIFHKLLIL